MLWTTAVVAAILALFRGAVEGTLIECGVDDFFFLKGSFFFLRNFLIFPIQNTRYYMYMVGIELDSSHTTSISRMVGDGAVLSKHTFLQSHCWSK